MNRPQRDGSKKGIRRALLRSSFFSARGRSRGSSHLGEIGSRDAAERGRRGAIEGNGPRGSPAPVVTLHVPDQVLWEG